MRAATWPAPGPILRGKLDAPRPAGGVGLSRFIELGAYVLAYGLLYGMVMGTFGGVFTPERWWQMLYSAAKVPLLLLLSFVLCVPSFYVFCSLLGLQRDFPQALAAIVAAQGVLAVTLASLAPLVFVVYASTDDYNAAVLYHGAPFLVASLAGQRALVRGYRPLIARNSRHRIAAILWLLAYVFVAIQLAWNLRPFVGSPRLPVEFFRADSFTNAYVALWRLVVG
ncbi:MAG TPA: hypothetical protein VNC50_05090 [Planctomycetia bacterium]|nr:hypothetical protein [Planctomycetia bacterium]